VWHEARGELPFLFVASAAATGAGAALLHTPTNAGVQRLAVAGAVGELVAAACMEHRLGELGDPYREGTPRRLRRVARTALVGGAALVALTSGRGRSGAGARLGGALLLAGSAAERFAVFRAGFASADDPRYVVGPQRARLAAAAGSSGA
jgi:hypothetical protein